jgi:hypothetical protein
MSSKCNSPTTKYSRITRGGGKKPPKKSFSKKSSGRNKKTKKKASKSGGEITEAQARQLQILADNPGISAAEFARKCWPKAKGWNEVCRVGVGRGHPNEYHEVEGAAMPIAAGAALGKLRQAGYARFDLAEDGRAKRHTISAKGLKALNQSKP